MVVNEIESRARLLILGHERCKIASAMNVNELFPEVYDQLRKLARAYLSRSPSDCAIQPTMIVHEAYLRLADQTRASWQGRTHFFAVGAMMMRRVLIDLIRRRHRGKRGGNLTRVTLDSRIDLPFDANLDCETFLAIHEALEKLEAEDAREAKIVEMHFFGGLSFDEIAGHLGVSLRTVQGDWTHARAWLKRALDAGTERPE